MATLVDRLDVRVDSVEVTDLIFAVDSIPAVLAITKDGFIALTSNIFAILGLRTFFFLLADIADRFHYLKTALAFILTFIGVKMMLPLIAEAVPACSRGTLAWMSSVAGGITLPMPKRLPLSGGRIA